MKNFLAELRRRNVYRVAAIYIIVAWLVLQVVDVFMEFMPLPDWTPSLVFLLLVVGFPVALVMAWAFELTPEGLRPEQPAESATRPARGLRPWDLVMAVALAAILGAWGWDQFTAREVPSTANSSTIDSIVVLPLDNLMNDADQAYFVEGMHDALITELSRIEALRVISRTSAMRYQETDKPVPEIARELGVDAVVEGSVLRAGNQVRINVQMIDASNDRHLWGEQFDRELTDILALYSDVTRRITDSIAVQINPAEARHLQSAAPLDASAYDEYLQGRALCDVWTPDSMRRGIDLMRHAVQRNPGFAPNHAGLAQCLQYASFYDYLAPAEIAQEALRAANRAVELDPGLDAAHVAKASVYWYLDFNAKAAAQSLMRALEINPEMTRALVHYSWLLGETGRFDEAEDLARRAIALEPFSTIPHVTLGQALFLRRDYASAMPHYRRALTMAPTDPSTNMYVAWVLEQQGEYDRAIGHLQDAIDASSGEPLYIAFLGYTQGQAGQRENALQTLEQLRNLQGFTDDLSFHQGLVYLGMDEYGEATRLLEEAFQARHSHMVYLQQGPQFDALRANPRFQALLSRFDHE